MLVFTWAGVPVTACDLLMPLERKGVGACARSRGVGKISDGSSLAERVREKFKLVEFV